jgi:hypothetical protein
VPSPHRASKDSHRGTTLLSCNPSTVVCTAANHGSVNQPHCPASTLSAVDLGAAGAPGPGGAVVGRRGCARGTAARRKALKASKVGPSKALGPPREKLGTSLFVMTWNCLNLLCGAKELALVNLLVSNRVDVMVLTET